MGAFFAASKLSVIVAPIIAAVEAGTLSQRGPYRPQAWTTPALTAITVPGTSAPAGPAALVKNFDGTPMPSAPAFQGTPPRVYVFDAVPRVDHARELRRTQNPIQTSASSPVGAVCDHAYLLPARVVLEIGMSDAMASYAPGVWTSNKSKSVSAYQQLVKLQEERTLFTLTTRLATYANMIVEGIRAPDTVETLHGLKATVLFSQIQTASGTAVSSRFIAESADGTGAPDSARPNATNATPLGTVQPVPPSAAVTLQHNIAAAAGTAAGKVLASLPFTVPGAGTWSSVSIGRLGGLLG